VNKNELVQMADILPPSIPVAVSTNVEIYIVAFVFFITVALYFLRSRKQRLQRIRLRYKYNKISNRQCAFELAGLLQHTNHYEKNGGVSWQAYSSVLQRACYSRESLDGAAMQQLLDETGQWL